MAWHHCEWEKVHGLEVLRVCGMPNGDHDGEHWPRIVVLDLSPEQYREFRENPLQFTINYDLYPEQPIQLMCHGGTLPMGKCVKKPCADSRYTVIVWHGRPSSALWLAGPQNCEDDDGGEGEE